jgi:hypothetical protein
MKKTGTIIIGKGTFHGILTSIIQKLGISVLISSTGNFLLTGGIIYDIIKGLLSK